MQKLREAMPSFAAEMPLLSMDRYRFTITCAQTCFQVQSRARHKYSNSEGCGLRTLHAQAQVHCV